MVAESTALFLAKSNRTIYSCPTVSVPNRCGVESLCEPLILKPYTSFCCTTNVSVPLNVKPPCLNSGPKLTRLIVETVVPLLSINASKLALTWENAWLPV